MGNKKYDGGVGTLVVDDVAAVGGNAKKYDGRVAARGFSGVADGVSMESEAVIKGGNNEQRLNLILSAASYEDLTRLAKEKGTTRADIMRLALGLIKVATNEAKHGHKLVIADKGGHVIKELILPG